MSACHGKLASIYFMCTCKSTISFLWQLNSSRELGDGLDNITRETENIGFTETTIATSGTDRILPDAMEDSEVSPILDYAYI